ncbi:heparan sulfate glucosamine 3-O-sulfotransferase 1-like [Ptychodera flava]|uniref:heparan sulfate glucosamine 3-O-sulfotransferase 1-like n=1 Tax=Ptychodera flava TaxID=63121 RepID=UPI003969BF07
MTGTYFNGTKAVGLLEGLQRCLLVHWCNTKLQREVTFVLLVTTALSGLVFTSNWAASISAHISSLDTKRDCGNQAQTVKMAMFGINSQTDSQFDSKNSSQLTSNFGLSAIPDTTEDPALNEEPTWEASYNATVYYEEKRKTSCYPPMKQVHCFTEPVDEKEFKEKDCQKRLPQVIIAGVRKCGTGTLVRFLNMHPNVAVTTREIHYFDNRYDQSMEWYLNKMQYSTPLQVPTEKTPTYFFRPYDAPQKILKALSKDVKIIVILCDPIRRAVSEYLQFFRVYNKTDINIPYFPKYLAQTFEESVIDEFNEIRVYNEIVEAGIYVKYVLRWMEYFPSKQLLYIDGEKFKVDPAAELRRVEKFVSLKPFFRREHFFLDPTKGFYCLKYPGKSCMNKSKGRAHPDIDQQVLKALCMYYTPYDKALESTLKRKFLWVGNC